METNEISYHEVLIWRAIQAKGERWFTNADISKMTPTISSRTVRIKTKKFAELGLLQQADVFPAHRFKLKPKADRSVPYIRRLEDATDAFKDYLEETPCA